MEERMRVVVGQRMIQGGPDIFLGWGKLPAVDGDSHFYMRQLRDMKGGLEITPKRILVAKTA